MLIPPYREVQPRIVEYFRESGCLGVVLVDLTPLARIERSFGANAYQTLRSQVDPLLGEAKAHVREDDVLTRDERDSDRYLFFLTGKRKTKNPFAAVDLQRLCDRVESFVTPRVARLTLPYLRERPAVEVGHGFVLWSPLENEERQILRLVEDARTSAELRRRLRERDQRDAVIEVIVNRSLWSAFQPIVQMETRDILGYEGLSRGPRGSPLEFPYALFGTAGRFDLVDELERACRRQVFVDWEQFGAPARLFVNTVPATVRDVSFLGRGVLDYLGPRLSPSMVTLEITEGQVIENLNLYREAMHSFLDLGFTFAIDDVGAGYSGLETIANIGASYLKIDMGLVRDIHEKKVSQQVVKAILDMGAAMGAAVIGEGIETKEEAETLRGLGLRYAQGYFFGRPIDPLARRPPQTAAKT
ncbi:MAG TPA: EAL domain-containing protein [Vicinamibacteria bacterium]|nr:EAL domain-containing protein [Vicinamibacteria bacterium]